MDPVRKKVTRRRVALSVVASGLLFSACAGENLFSLVATAGALGPTVLITAPGEGFTISVGDSIQILAEVTAPDGATSAAYRGDYAASGDSAYTAESEPLNGIAFVRLDNSLRAVDGQAAGSVYIVVEVTDQMGEVGKDSVKITIN